MNKLISTIVTLVFFANSVFAQSKVEVYVSTHDCLKCISGLSNIIGYFEKNEVPKSNLKIITDYKSNVQRLLREFPYLNNEMVFWDKEIIEKNIPDNRSKCVIVKDGIFEKEYALTEMTSEILASHLRERAFVIKNIQKFQDSIFESGNFYSSGDMANIALLQRNIQIYGVFNFHQDSVLFTYGSSAIDSSSYAIYLNKIAVEKGLDLLSYDSALIICNEAHLPMSSISAVSADGSEILIYRSVYFFLKDTADNLINRGFVFLEKFDVRNSEIKIGANNIVLIEPFTKEDSIRLALYIYYNHQVVKQNLYFAHYKVLSGTFNIHILDSNYYGCLYSHHGNRIKIEKEFKFAKTDISDSMQIIIKKFSYGNNPKYLMHRGRDFILFKNIAKILSLNDGKLIDINEFVHNEFKYNLAIKSNYILDAFTSDDALCLVYYSSESSSRLNAVLIKNKDILKQSLDYSEKIDFLATDGETIRILRKDEDMNEIILTTFTLLE